MIGICGNYNILSFAESLDVVMPGEDLVAGAAGGFYEELSDLPGDFAQLDMCVLALDWQRLVPDLFNLSFGDDHVKIRASLKGMCDCITSLLKKFRDRTSAPILLFSPITPVDNSFGFIDRLMKPSVFDLFSECQVLFNSLCRSVSGVYPVDLNRIASLFGHAVAFDPHSDVLADQPFSLIMNRGIAEEVAAMITQIKRGPLKCIVLDCDNTLWGGGVGDVGPEGVVLDKKGPGRFYWNLQREILRFHKQGIILAICSKNNTCDALEVIEAHPHQLLRPSHIASYRINWDDKPKNIVEIAQELNIGLDSMLFVDDNPVERDMVRAALPDVAILDLSNDPALYAETLVGCSRLRPVQLTEEDGLKGVQYAQERIREQAKQLSANVEEYLRHSEIKVSIRKIERMDDPSIPRISQLFLKTNQFNLTTIRYSESDLTGMMQDAKTVVLSLSLSDRYGDSGIVGCCVVVGNGIENFVMSCRAFGRQIEKALLAEAVAVAKGYGDGSVIGKFAASKRNAMVREFYSSNGFTIIERSEERGEYRFDYNDRIVVVPDWISIV